jgi:hypothetical protein
MGLTVIIPYRPRTHWDSLPTLEKVIDSLTVPFLISVHGPMDPRLVRWPVIHEPSPRMFNRSRALNNGINTVGFGLVFCNDADCIWTHDLAPAIIDAIHTHNHVVYRVTANGNVNGHGAGMQGFRADSEVRWDERYEGYGREDIDLLCSVPAYKELSGGLEHVPHPHEEDGWADNWARFREKWDD